MQGESVEEVDGILFLTMALIEGTSLDHLIRRGWRSVRSSTSVSDLNPALPEHMERVIHRCLQ